MGYSFTGIIHQINDILYTLLQMIGAGDVRIVRLSVAAGA